jgi:dTDP-4-dehydrorhamnose 3,5-epimerase
MTLNVGIDGVAIRPWPQMPDHRGVLATIYKDGPDSLGPFVQWNLVQSTRGSLRGVHAHSRYHEYYVPLHGRMFLFLKDVRAASPTFGAEFHCWSEALASSALFVPIGVAHAVYFDEDGLLLYGLSTEWTGEGEFGCRWDDPGIGAPWPVQTPVLSDRDAAAPSLAAMVAALNADLPS